jgi:hypothetical protein
MDRDTFRTLAAGKFAMTNLEGTIDKQQMLVFTDGAVFAYDQLNKNKQSKQPTEEVATNETKD